MHCPSIGVCACLPPPSQLHQHPYPIYNGGRIRSVPPVFGCASVSHPDSLKRTDRRLMSFLHWDRMATSGVSYTRTVTHACLPCTQVSPEPEQPQPKPVATITVPYIQGLSEPIKRVLRNLNIQVCLHPQKNSMPVAEAKGSINARCPEWSDL